MRLLKFFLLFDLFRKVFNPLLFCWYLFFTNGGNFDIFLVFLFATNWFSEKFTGMFSGAQWNKQTKKGCKERNLVFKIAFFKGRRSLTRKCSYQKKNWQVFVFARDILQIILRVSNFKKLAKVCKIFEKLYRIYVGATKLKYQAQDF